MYTFSSATDYVDCFYELVSFSFGRSLINVIGRETIFLSLQDRAICNILGRKMFSLGFYLLSVWEETLNNSILKSFR